MVVDELTGLDRAASSLEEVARVALFHRKVVGHAEVSEEDIQGGLDGGRGPVGNKVQIHVDHAAHRDHARFLDAVEDANFLRDRGVVFTWRQTNGTMVGGVPADHLLNLHGRTANPKTAAGSRMARIVDLNIVDLC